jgi:photosystem II stability/assembly factor-like uncharacterized protein
MTARRGCSLLLCLCLLPMVTVVQARTIGRGRYVSREFPPSRPDPMPVFSVPRAGETLDEGWHFVQPLYDANANYPALFNAVPVGMGFARGERGYLATLHTLFRTTNGGTSWSNLDPAPPPATASAFVVLRSPMYIHSLAVRPVRRESANYDSVLMSTFNGDSTDGYVRLVFRALDSLYLYPLPNLSAPYWLTLVTMPDSAVVCALAGLDGQLYRNAALGQGVPWEHLNPDKVLIRAGREDTLRFVNTWVDAVTSTDPMIIAVGSHHWISRNRGAKWQIRSAADSVFDNVVSFVDTVYGMTAGGTVSPALRGWVHRSTDGGRIWSGRLLDVNLPLRAVKMVTREIAFAAGGYFNTASGHVWMTSDGGQTWSLDLSASAELDVLEARRVNAAYVDVFAAGVFPDFRGGVWRKRVWAPDTTGAVVVADPDTLEFGDLAAGIADTLSFELRNVGVLPDTVTLVTGAAYFSPLWPFDMLPLTVGESAELAVVFESDNLGVFTATVRVFTVHSGTVDIYCHARVPLAAGPPAGALLPSDARLAVSPNPGNATFEVRFELSRAAVAGLRVFDLSGRLVETLVEASFAPGEFSRLWDASALPTGIYFVRLDVGGSASVTQKVLLVK